MSGGLGVIFDNPKRKEHWLKRVVAYIIDSIIITIIYVAIIVAGTMIFVGSVVGGAMTGNAVGGVFGGLIILFVFILIAIIFSIAYWIYFDAKGGTPGKKFMKLKPVSLVGEMTYTKAAIRNGSKIVGGFIGGMIEGAVGIMLIGFVIELIIVFLDMYMGITSRKDPRQKYTDTIADTTVVRTDLEEDVDGMKYIPPEPEAETTSTTTPSTGLGTPEKEVKEEPMGKPGDRPEIVQKYMDLFELNQDRAQALYNSGYKRLEDFKDAIAEDLVLVDKINPTIARNIIKKMAEI